MASFRMRDALVSASFIVRGLSGPCRRVQDLGSFAHVNLQPSLVQNLIVQPPVMLKSSTQPVFLSCFVLSTLLSVMRCGADASTVREPLPVLKR
mmetsp:Transcript_17326/g.57388  ORF Transcript_17326/g.57388 Transcript_17326/m.57388 type:complete len:94 (+) Transcript_17326:3425-3706(+)